MKSRYDCNLSLSEKLIGHSVTIPMDNHYGAFSHDALFQEYKKAIPELTISKEERQKVQIETKNKKLEELEQVKLEKNQQQKQINELQVMINNLQSEQSKITLEAAVDLRKDIEELKEFRKSLDNRKEN